MISSIGFFFSKSKRILAKLGEISHRFRFGENSKAQCYERRSSSLDLGDVLKHETIGQGIC